ncbi:unnamed protein product [Meloidogyne enterolobii]|uniref:Uncharacterized protein n=1 Tax=Meloidogyne enterolobii TaxID=390850 RepID=A0ACB1A0Z6_MELEN
MPKRGSSFYLTETKNSSDSSSNGNGHNSTSKNQNIEFSGWLYKWTNYVKGYRKRWFLIDSMGNLKYYRFFCLKFFYKFFKRNSNDVNGPSRGSIKMEEASVRSDQHDGLNMIITVPFSPNLHLRAINDLDRSKWLKALENAKHFAIKRVSSLEDDENETEKFLSKTLELKEYPLGDFEGMNKELNELAAKFSNELEGFLHFAVGHLNAADAKKCVAKANSVKILRDGTLKLTDQLLTKYKKECESLCRLAHSQNEKHQELQRQYEILARQHQQLEGEALRLSARVADESSKNTGGSLSYMTALGGPTPPLLKNQTEEEEEDQFQDATDTLPEEEKNKFDFFEENFEGGGSEGNGGGGGGGWSEKSSSFCFDEEEIEMVNKGGNVAVVNNSTKNKLNEVVGNSSLKSQNNNLDLSKCKIILPDQQNLTTYQENTQPIVVSNLPIPKRRSKIPPKPESYGLNLWSIMKNCIGKELTRIPLPAILVNFNEPLSMLQRITEDLEYSYLLDRASEKLDISERLAYTAAFAISVYSATAKRTTKPFNPLLGETFEFDRRADLGWRSLTEQVSHHPPAAAMHTEGVNWELSQEFMVASRFRGKYMSVIPTGYTQIKFKDGKANFIFQKVTTTVHNIIVGKLWIDNHGTMNIVNHVSGERANIKFHSYRIILDKKGNARFYIFGYWDSYLNIALINNQKNQQGKVLIETGEPKRIWTVKEPLGDSSMFNFTKLAIEMNEPDDQVAPTDSRFRPDQRLMENGDWDGANDRKNELEDKQRKARRKAEAEAERAIANNQQPPEYQACWFQKVQDTNTGSVIHTIRGNEYWECKEKKDWSRCPNIY